MYAKRKNQNIYLSRSEVNVFLKNIFNTEITENKTVEIVFQGVQFEFIFKDENCVISFPYTNENESVWNLFKSL